MVPSFADLGVPPQLRAALAQRGIAEPFPIQAATIPDALAGRDICGRAPTGSGKTLAFGLAIATLDPIAAPRRPRALVLVPTRELAAQVASEIGQLMPGSGRGKKRHDEVVAVYGGASYGPQRRALSQGAAVVVACPGRLEDLLEQGDVDLRDVDIVVLDEADRMADMGFLPSVRRILDKTNEKRQTLLFSATLDGEIDKLVRQYQRDPARHEVVPDEADGTAVEHVFWRSEPSDRVGLTAALVNRHGQTIVFSRTRHGADRIARQLNQSGIDAVAIHGSRSQSQRERALAAFSAGRASALVATDVAARGIHVDDVACVLHFDLPPDPKDYVHRSGRTGRAGASGVVVAFVPRDQYKAARTLQRAVGLPDRIDNPDVTAADIPARDANRRPTALEVQAGPTPTRSGGQGGGSRRPRGEGGTGGSGRPRNGSGRSRSGQGYGSGGGQGGGKPAAKKPTWRKRANAAKSRSAGAGRPGSR